MEHEVFVPVPPTALRRALGAPTRVPDCVPGLRAEPGPEPRTAPGGDGIAVHGRLRLRAGSHTITYRGGLRLAARPDDSWALHVSATEARGEGSVRARLSLTLAETEGGTRVRFAGSGEVAGRLLDEAGPQAAESVLHRLLNRFAANLGRAGEALAGEDAGRAEAGETGAEGPGDVERGAEAPGGAGPGGARPGAGEPGAKAAGAAGAGAGGEAGTEEESGTAFGEDAMTDGTGRTSGTGEQPEDEGPESARSAERPEGPEEPEGAATAEGADNAEAAKSGDDAEPVEPAEASRAENAAGAEGAEAADAGEGAGGDAPQGAHAGDGAGTGAPEAADAADAAKGEAVDAGDTSASADTADSGDTSESGDDDLLGIVPDTPASVFETDVPPSSLGRDEARLGAEEGEPPAEAAHARRTMIGRSAEEVDHAPPRGRYAPEAVGGAGSTANTLRWAAPVAALVVASVVVAGRALRRRH
ncbi:hypothetical protein ACQKFA_16660 [Streptomyces sp. CH6]|uniref:hypothetical protein n=1 Tax=Streptomyces sp. CH6 TaxID=3420320 RepID=UPI003CFEAC5A